LKYKKLLTTSRFNARAQGKFAVDVRTKTLVIGRRDPSSSETAFLGKVLEQSSSASLLDHNVAMDISFPHVVGIFGSRGSGKSYDLGIILEGIFNPDRGAVRDAAIVFDIQDQFWTLGYSPDPNLDIDQPQLHDLSAWGLDPTKVNNINILTPRSSDTQVQDTTEFSLAAAQLTYDDWLAILDLERYSAMGQSLSALLNSSPGAPPSTLADLCDPRGVLANFQQGTVDGLRWRLESLAATEIVGATGLSVDTLLEQGTLTVILMRNLPESVRGLVVGVIARMVADRMGRIQQSRKVAVRTGKADVTADLNLTGRLWLVLDEAHVLVPSDGGTAATAPLIDYVKRGRDAGLSLIFATQQPSAVNSKLMSQVDITLTHMLGFDADLTAAIARMPTRTSVDYEIDSHGSGSLADVIRSLGPGECVVADGASSRIFLAKIRPRSTAHGGATPQ
jgi:ABC-type dipeptide/oligopeptide/nickel transport system ATPase component